MAKVILNITQAKVPDSFNSIKLQSSANGTDWTDVGTFTYAVGAQEVTIASPAANLFYRVVFDAKQASANGNCRIDSVKFMYAEESSEEQHVMPWYTEGEGNQAIHFEGAGIWTWVKYDSLGYADFAAFSAAKENFVASYDSDPAASIVDIVVSDDNASLKYARVYIVLSAAYNTGTLTLSIPGTDGNTYTGTLGFNAGALASINGAAI